MDKPGGEASSSTPPILRQFNLPILLHHKMFPSSPLLPDTQATLSHSSCGKEVHHSLACTELEVRMLFCLLRHFFSLCKAQTCRSVCIFSVSNPKTVSHQHATHHHKSTAGYKKLCEALMAGRQQSCSTFWQPSSRCGFRKRAACIRS